jgi:AAA family ATP:ADP antiporter
MPTQQNPGDPAGINTKRISSTAAMTLGLVMAAHMLLETGVDALFLANISVERLPLVTLAIAALALLASRARLAEGHRRSLIALQAIAAVGTFAMWSLVVFADAQYWIFYLLYVWSGLITSMIVMRFWIFIGDLFTIIEGKRLFASIAMGGTVGALVGSGAAALLAQGLNGNALLLASSCFYTASLIPPCVVLGGADPDGASRAQQTSTPQLDLGATLRKIFEHPYTIRVAGLVLIGGVTITLGDYLFKSVVAEEVPVDQLAVTLSRIYFGLNVLALCMLALGVTRIVRRLGVDRAGAVLPALITLAALGVLAGGALAATIVLKVVDGTLRNSLHRTTTELLFLPMSSTLRSSVKGVIDVVGQAGSKAIGSLIILLLVMAPDPRMIVAGAVAISSLIWVLAALRLRRSYLDNFRETLSQGVIQTAIDHPELDLESAGSLIRALSDPDERRALAALRLLVERDQVSLIPSLVLYHPSANVVSFALDTFTLAKRDDFMHLFEFLLHHEDARVRAATVRASWVLEGDRSRLHPLVDSECMVVRLCAVAGLVALGEESPERYGEVLEEAIDYEDLRARLAASIALRLDYQPVARNALIRMAQDEEEEVAREAIAAIRASGDAWFTEPLVDLLGDRRVREDVREALIERGLAALAVLEEALTRPETQIRVLRHIPRTIARFPCELAPAAAEVLIASLSRVQSGMVRYKVLRGLEMLVLRRGMSHIPVDPAFVSQIDDTGLREELSRTLTRSLDLLRLEASLSRAQGSDPGLSTSGGELLIELLEDKRELATKRIFTLLGLLYQSEDFRVIHTGLESSDAADRASAAELIETLLPLGLARPVLGLVAPLTAEARLASADPARPSRLFDLSEALRRLLADQSRSLRAVAMYYAGDVEFTPTAGDLPVEAREDGQAATPTGLRLKDRAIATLREIAEARPRRARTLSPALRAR